jgi:DNA-binding LacI/PurR family transcriptional regulator
MPRRSAHRPTLEDVATLAGVGRGTASRVINGGARVSKSAREAVEEAIAELGYVPNRAARSLASQRTDAVALVIAESEERVFGEPFFAGVIRGIGTALTAGDRQLVLLLAPADRTATLTDYLTQQHVDGVLLLSLHDDDTLATRIAEHGVPVVLGGGTRPGEGIGYVDNDNELGTRLAVEHLLARGRRSIATITGPLDMEVGRVRLRAFKAALESAGIEVVEELIAVGDFSQQSGEAAMRQLLERRPDLDAVFCANDPMAAGALVVLREAGRRVPEDVSVVGFDDSRLALSTHPTLTTVHQSAEAMGREMVALLLDLINGEASPEARVLPTRLVERESS